MSVDAICPAGSSSQDSQRACDAWLPTTAAGQAVLSLNVRALPIGGRAPEPPPAPRR